MGLLFLAKPTDVNWGGKVHGGTAMQWIDEAGAACTMEWSAERTVAVYAGGIRFYRPISIGDLIEVDARMLGQIALLGVGNATSLKNQRK